MIAREINGRRDGWSEDEKQIIRRFYPAEGAAGCAKRMPLRTTNAIKRRARILGVKTTVDRGKGPRPSHSTSAPPVPAPAPLDDPRDFTARLLGDPPPGRSALDKRGGVL